MTYTAASSYRGKKTSSGSNHVRGLHDEDAFMDAAIGDDEGLDDDFDDMDGNDLDDDGGSAPRRKSEKAKWTDGEVSSYFA